MLCSAVQGCCLPKSKQAIVNSDTVHKNANYVQIRLNKDDNMLNNMLNLSISISTINKC